MKKALNFKVSALCGKLLRKAAGSIVFAVTMLLLSGCGGIMGVYNSSITSPTKTGFFLAYDSETVLEQSQVATITSANGLEIDGIDCVA
ncbi:MAG: hypothetical protein LBD45_09565, partial [Bacteroidales bacterium]|nr:hypothetical protein [Bacteroidales bacterium]